MLCCLRAQHLKTRNHWGKEGKHKDASNSYSYTYSQTDLFKWTSRILMFYSAQQSCYIIVSCITYSLYNFREHHSHFSLRDRERQCWDMNKDRFLRTISEPIDSAVLELQMSKYSLWNKPAWAKILSFTTNRAIIHTAKGLVTLQFCTILQAEYMVHRRFS